MATVEQNGITFNNYNDVEVLPVGQTIRLGINEGPDEDNLGIVNAVDISWNGAVVDSDHIINTTGLLINYIKGAYSSGGSSLSGGLNADEIDKLRQHISSDSQSETTIKNIDSRISALETSVGKLELFLSDNVKTKLTNLISRASKVTLTTNSGGYLLNIKVELASGGGTTSSGQAVGGITFGGAVHTGVVDVGEELNKKLDKTAISYNNDSGNLTVDLNL